jgi:hypothetical protein
MTREIVETKDNNKKRNNLGLDEQVGNLCNINTVLQQSTRTVVLNLGVATCRVTKKLQTLTLTFNLAFV